MPETVARSHRFWFGIGLVASLVAMALVIWASQQFMMRSFSVEQGAKAKLRATLYAGNIQSAMQRHALVPLLLARDPILRIALRSGNFDSAEERLTTFSEEISADAIFLLDAEGRVVAASDDRPRGILDADQPYFVDAVESAGRVFSQTPGENGTYLFHYSYPVTVEEEFLGVVVVTVDLGLYERGWRLSNAMIAILDSDDRFLLASQPGWRGRTLAEVMAPDPNASRFRSVLESARDSFNAPSYVRVGGSQRLLTEVPVAFRNWRLVYFEPLDEILARVHARLAFIAMLLALLLALGFYMLSRRTSEESRRIQRESNELRALNRKLSAEIAARQRVEKNLKEAEQSLEQASKLAALGQMSAAVSHELNQPLAAMKTYLAGARLLLQRRRPEEALTSFQRIDDLINRMGGITRQLKSYARKGDVELEPVDLRQSVHEALSMMAPQLGKMAVSITTTLPSEPVIIYADPLRIEQIIVNILRNALDAVRNQDDRQVKILLAQGETILLSIEDNGGGLEDPDKLFEPFYTTKTPGEGLGLGLAISAGFAAEMGGRLVARNAPDGGAIFELLLPLERPQSRAAE